MSIKRSIASEAELEKRIHAEVNTVLEAIQENHTHEIAAYEKAKKQRWTAIVLTIFWFVFWFVPEYGWLEWLALVQVLVLVFAIRAWWNYLQQYQAVQAYHRAITGQVLRSIAAVFGLEESFRHEYQAIDPELGIWQRWWQSLTQPPAEYQQKVKELLQTSELITEPYNRFTVDDSWQLQFMEQPLEMFELSIQNVTGSGKNRQVKEIFTGYFVSYTIPTSVDGRTFISTDGDRGGYGHQSFWPFGKQTGVQATELEWNQFEELLHVASDNPTEARYILTPDVMQDVYDWWAEKPQNIRISFIKNQVCILFPDTKMRLGRSVDTLNEGTVTAYMLLLARPMWHILCLLEDVRGRFR